MSVIAVSSWRPFGLVATQYGDRPAGRRRGGKRDAPGRTDPGTGTKVGWPLTATSDTLLTMPAPTIELPRLPSGRTGSLGLDDGAGQLRLFIRLVVPVGFAFAAGLAFLGLAYGAPSALFGAAGLGVFSTWTLVWCLPRIGRISIDRLIRPLAVAIYVPIVSAGFLLHDAVAVATLLPLALALPYLPRRDLAALAAVALAVAILVGGGASLVASDTSIPWPVLTVLNVVAVATVFGFVVLLIGQFAVRLRSTTTELANVIRAVELAGADARPARDRRT